MESKSKFDSLTHDELEYLTKSGTLEEWEARSKIIAKRRFKVQSYKPADQLNLVKKYSEFGSYMFTPADRNIDERFYMTEEEYKVFKNKDSYEKFPETFVPQNHLKEFIGKPIVGKQYHFYDDGINYPFKCFFVGMYNDLYITVTNEFDFKDLNDGHGATIDVWKHIKEIKPVLKFSIEQIRSTFNLKLDDEFEIEGLEKNGYGEIKSVYQNAPPFLTFTHKLTDDGILDKEMD